MKKLLALSVSSWLLVGAAHAQVFPGTGILLTPPSPSRLLNSPTFTGTVTFPDACTWASTGVNCTQANTSFVWSPTGTGTFTVNPATAGTLNNVTVGLTIPLASKFTTVIATTSVTNNTGSLVLDGTTGNGGVSITHAGVTDLFWTNSSAGADLKLTSITNNGGWKLRFANDAFGAATDAYLVSRGTTYNVSGHTWYTSTSAGTAVAGMILVPGGWTVGPGAGTAFTATLSSLTYVSCTALTTNASGLIGCTASDSRLKIDDGTISPQAGLTAVLALPTPHKFHFKPGLGPEGQMQGFFAQDIERVRPDLVRIGAPSVAAPDGVKQFDQTKLIADLVQAVKALKASNDNLASRLIVLESRK